MGQLGDALETLRRDVSPDRIVIETSGSAFPATLAMEVNRLSRETDNFVLDGVVVVIDVENWKGYDDTSYTAKMQARYTDLIVFNKWELVDERRYDECLDRVGDLEVQVANVKSDKGWVDKDLLLGLDSSLAKIDDSSMSIGFDRHHNHAEDHQREVEVLSVTLSSANDLIQSVNLGNLEAFLESTPKDEIYRIKAIIFASQSPKSSDGTSDRIMADGKKPLKYILNWAFGRWTFTPIGTTKSDERENASEDASNDENNSLRGSQSHPIVRMTIILARYEAEKWKNRITTEGCIAPEKPIIDTKLEVKRLM